MSDTPEDKAKRRQLLRELWRLEEGMELHNRELTPEEVVAIVKQVRKEMAEERAQGEQK